MLWNLGVKRATGKLQFHADRVVRFGAGVLLALDRHSDDPLAELIAAARQSLPVQVTNPNAGVPTCAQHSNTDQQMSFRNRWSSSTSSRIASGS
jgi:hypothetical protein